jgi:hypothetical protein
LPALNSGWAAAQPVTNGNAAVARPTDLRNPLRVIVLYDFVIAITFP